jgi:8-oxo-dGTP pyrophosphatase MutT (NUDIX family)
MNRFFSRMMIHSNGLWLVMFNIERQRWEFPGGKVAGNERPIDAGLREMTEEIGVTLSPRCHIKPVTQRSIIIEDHSEWLGYFWFVDALTLNGTPHIVEPDKHRDLIWVSVEDMLRLPQIPYLFVEVARLAHDTGLV